MNLNYRCERIERLLEELRYEITRGVMEREIPEALGFTFIIPVSHTHKNGVVYGRFELFPVEHAGLLNIPPSTRRRLQLVGGKHDDNGGSDAA